MSTTQWLEVSHTSGQDKQEITLRALEHYGNQPRNTTLTAQSTTGHKPTNTLEYTQEAAAPYFKLTGGSNFTCDYAGGTITTTALTNIDFSGTYTSGVKVCQGEGSLRTQTTSAESGNDSIVYVGSSIATNSASERAALLDSIKVTANSSNTVSWASTNYTRGSSGHVETEFGVSVGTGAAQYDATLGNEGLYEVTLTITLNQNQYEKALPHYFAVDADGISSSIGDRTVYIVQEQLPYVGFIPDVITVTAEENLSSTSLRSNSGWVISSPNIILTEDLSSYVWASYNDNIVPMSGAYTLGYSLLDGDLGSKYGITSSNPVEVSLVFSIEHTSGGTLTGPIDFFWAEQEWHGGNSEPTGRHENVISTIQANTLNQGQKYQITFKITEDADKFFGLGQITSLNTSVYGKMTFHECTIKHTEAVIIDDIAVYNTANLTDTGSALLLYDIAPFKEKVAKYDNVTFSMIYDTYGTLTDFEWRVLDSTQQPIATIVGPMTLTSDSYTHSGTVSSTATNYSDMTWLAVYVPTQTGQGQLLLNSFSLYGSQTTGSSGSGDDGGAEDNVPSGATFAMTFSGDYFPLTSSGSSSSNGYFIDSSTYLSSMINSGVEDIYLQLDLTSTDADGSVDIFCTGSWPVQVGSITGLKSGSSTRRIYISKSTIENGGGSWSDVTGIYIQSTGSGTITCTGGSIYQYASTSSGGDDGTKVFTEDTVVVTSTTQKSVSLESSSGSAKYMALYSFTSAEQALLQQAYTNGNTVRVDITYSLNTACKLSNFRFLTSSGTYRAISSAGTMQATTTTTTTNECSLSDGIVSVGFYGQSSTTATALVTMTSLTITILAES